MFPHRILTVADIESAKPPDKPYKIAVGGSLYVLIHPSGSKYWRFKYRFNGKEGNLAIGVYPEVSLSEALTARNNTKKLLLSEINPATAKKEQVKAKREKIIEQSNLAIARVAFQISLRTEGGLTIMQNDRIMHFSSEQAEAIRSFLNISPDKQLVSPQEAK